MYGPFPPGQPGGTYPLPVAMYGPPRPADRPDIRDGDPLVPGRRALAWLIDFGFVVGAAVLLGIVTFHRIRAMGSESLSGGGVWAVLSSKGDLDIMGATGELVGELWHNAVRAVVEALAALVIVQFLYQFIGLAWKGRSVGKTLLDIQIRLLNQAPLGKKRAAARAAIATVTDTGLFALAAYVLIRGQVLLSVLIWLIAVTAFWGNALPVLGRRRRTMNDRMLGTIAVRTLLHRAVTERVTMGGQRAVEGANRLASHPKVQQAITSQRGQQVHGFGLNAVARGREVTHKTRQAYRTCRGPDPDVNVAPADVDVQARTSPRVDQQPIADHRAALIRSPTENGRHRLRSPQTEPASRQHLHNSPRGAPRGQCH